MPSVAEIRRGLAACLVPPLMALASAAQAKPLYILVVGDSIAANCNEHVYPAAPGVLQIALDGSEKPAADPLDWADCRRGSTWVPLGRQLIEAGMADKVIFMSIALSGTKASDWQTPEGKAYPKLQKAIGVLQQKGVKFDFAFWQQGDADIGGNAPRYTRSLRVAMHHIAMSVPIRTWLIAHQSSCHGKRDPKIAQAQSFAAMNYLMDHFPGPDTDALGSAERFDGCNLNQAGQEKMARAWLAAMQAARADSAKVQKESLLYYFK